jgi:hypothetical protein
MIGAVVPPLAAIISDTPLRLGAAATLALPDGAMTASGLRRRLIPGSEPLNQGAE